MAETLDASVGLEPLIGETLANRYQIEMRLGEGAMGAVYRARHVKVGRPFAVKVLHARLLEDPKIAQRFEREAELAGRLHHPNVIGVVDVGETPNGMRYMVMDFAEGRDLAAMLDQAPMPAERIIHLTRQLLEGLYHAHEQGLIHRDFKPENIIVETDMHGAEVPRIVDFGIAILREGGDGSDGQGRLTTNGLVLGTPHYMAPEQAVADPIDHRIDLFALGIVIYEMLCGKLPFDGTGAEVARANLLLDPPPISQRVPYLEVDPLLEAFSRRLMAKRRDDRPPTAKAARELLDLIVRDRPAAAVALGVPAQASTRLPAITQPQTPEPRHAAQGNDTFPPPFSAAASVPALPPASVATRRPASQAETSTAVTPPLDYPVGTRPPIRRRWMFAAFGLVGAAAVTVFALALRGGEPAEAPPTPPAERTPVAMTPEPTQATAPTPVMTHGGSAAAVADVVPEVVESPPEVKTTAKLPPKPIGKPKDPKVGKPAETKQPEIKQPEVPAKDDAAAVAAKYREVGQKLSALGPAANELWPRYRMIRIQDAMTRPDKRAEALATLARLDREIAAFTKTK